MGARMSDEKNLLKRKEPPQTEDEWAYLIDGIEKAHLGWIVTGPIVAVVKNWKALLAIVVVIAWINTPEIIAAFKAIAGIGGK